MGARLPIGSLDTESWKEGGGSSAAGGTLGIPSRAPNPNAANVFINWFLSREGQIALQKLGRPDAHNSRRIDIPNDTSILITGWSQRKKILIWRNPSIRI